MSELDGERRPVADTFTIGLNPYGLAYTVGLAGAGTARANPSPIGLQGFVSVAREIGARCVELHGEWLFAMSDGELGDLRTQLESSGVLSIVSSSLQQRPGETLESAIRAARAIGASLVRLHLTPVLEGARARWGQWREMAAHAASTLCREAARAEDAGVALAIENHQDFGSEELVAMAEAAGPAVGVVFDTGNPFSVAEDPVAFARRAAHRIRHVHLKDYRAQFTEEGFRLIRCAVGDGAVPFAEIAAELRGTGRSVTASIEPGALEARHIRLFTPEWWVGYPPRDAAELGVALGRLRRAQLAEEELWTTPWERGQAPDAIVEYEMNQIYRSAQTCRAFGWRFLD
jgi:sugar phosphate isomerase/epimerase